MAGYSPADVWARAVSMFFVSRKSNVFSVTADGGSCAEKVRRRRKGSSDQGAAPWRRHRRAGIPNPRFRQAFITGPGWLSAGKDLALTLLFNAYVAMHRQSCFISIRSWAGSFLWEGPVSGACSIPVKSGGGISGRIFSVAVPVQGNTGNIRSFHAESFGTACSGRMRPEYFYLICFHGWQRDRA